MTEFEKFEFNRSRGVIWVCDLAGSSKHLNDDQVADDLEEFLPRLYWTASMAVEAAGGRFIKWTGDGFLAWFETPLHRTLGERGATVFNAAWHLTFLTNVTQLGLRPQQRFKIRHGVAYEQDALLIEITRPGGYKSLDIVGRAVVLAFRLSGVPADFPGIVTQKDLIDASIGHSNSSLSFRKWNVNAEEKLKYFKGQRWGTTSVYVSSGKTKKLNSKAVARLGKRAVSKAEGEVALNDAELKFAKAFLARMRVGPDRCQDVVDEYLAFLKDAMLKAVKRLLTLPESQDYSS